MRNLEQVVRKITFLIEKKKPKNIDEKWINKNSKASYKFVIDNNLDWDLVIKSLDKSLQPKWNKGFKLNNRDEYFDEFEVEQILKKYKDKLYTFVIYRSKVDMEICDRISILLVRLSQKGNICAREKLINAYEDILDKWIEYHKLISRWKGNEEKMFDVFERCIRKYRYSGTFLGYLKRSLELQALALPKVKIISLNYVSKITGKEFHETLIQD